MPSLNHAHDKIGALKIDPFRAAGGAAGKEEPRRLRREAPF
jgi:hypothetical protein